MQHTIEDVRGYWDSHLNLTQFLTDANIQPGSDEFFRLLDGLLDRYEYKRPLLARFAAGRKGDSLLEIGCGLGVELVELGRLGFHVTGVDLSPRAVQLCSNYLAKRGIKGTCKAQNAESLDFADASFDAVYSSGVLQHTPSIDRAIAEIWRVLKPGGRILIVLYHRHSWFYVLHKLSNFNIEFQSDDAPIINTYTRHDLRKRFRRFENLEIGCEYYRPVPTKRTGILPTLYNTLLVPGLGMLPESFVRRYGWHLVLTGNKP